ncbi:lipopolysaccharide core biosynthesis family protein [Escherichia coli DEC7B]|nr:lipopolysaccharide core biosynthesis family protein [Escherichia coli DEC7B]
MVTLWGNYEGISQGLRLIDLSGKKTTAVLKAKDRIDLERHYNIKNELKDFGYTYLIFKKKLKSNQGCKSQTRIEEQIMIMMKGN